MFLSLRHNEDIIYSKLVNNPFSNQKMTTTMVLQLIDQRPTLTTKCHYFTKLNLVNVKALDCGDKFFFPSREREGGLVFSLKYVVYKQRAFIILCGLENGAKGSV